MMSFESSMGLPGVAALYMTTKKEEHRDIMIRLADLLIKAFEQEDGLWGKLYSGDTNETIPTNYWSKALGYCVDGLIEVHRAAPDRGYLEKAIRINRSCYKGSGIRRIMGRTLGQVAEVCRRFVKKQPHSGQDCSSGCIRSLVTKNTSPPE